VTEPIWLDKRDALALHDRLLVLYGGAAGLRDNASLESALARARHIRSYADAPDVIAMAAAYTAGIVGNHPFIDGNKRTGFVVGVLFLELNGYRFTASEEDTANAVMKLAGGEIDAAAYAHFLRANTKLESLPRR
jgi:death-on-curing protein